MSTTVINSIRCLAVEGSHALPVIDVLDLEFVVFKLPSLETVFLRHARIVASARNPQSRRPELPKSLQILDFHNIDFDVPCEDNTESLECALVHLLELFTSIDMFCFRDVTCARRSQLFNFKSFNEAIIRSEDVKETRVALRRALAPSLGLSQSLPYVRHVTFRLRDLITANFMNMALYLLGTASSTGEISSGVIGKRELVLHWLHLLEFSVIVATTLHSSLPTFHAPQLPIDLSGFGDFSKIGVAQGTLRGAPLSTQFSIMKSIVLQLPQTLQVAMLLWAIEGRRRRSTLESLEWTAIDRALSGLPHLLCVAISMTCQFANNVDAQDAKGVLKSHMSGGREREILVLGLLPLEQVDRALLDEDDEDEDDDGEEEDTEEDDADDEDDEDDEAGSDEVSDELG